MPHEYDEVYTAAANTGDMRFCSGRTGATSTERLVEPTADFVARYAANSG